VWLRARYAHGHTASTSAFNCVLAVAAANVILRRDVAFDFALPF
jgi:hypothetical protein